MLSRQQSETQGDCRTSVTARRSETSLRHRQEQTTGSAARRTHVVAETRAVFAHLHRPMEGGTHRGPKAVAGRSREAHRNGETTTDQTKRGFGQHGVTHCSSAHLEQNGTETTPKPSHLLTTPLSPVINQAPSSEALEPKGPRVEHEIPCTGGPSRFFVSYPSPIRVRVCFRDHAIVPKDLTPLSLAFPACRKPLQLHKAKRLATCALYLLNCSGTNSQRKVAHHRCDPFRLRRFQCCGAQFYLCTASGDDPPVCVCKPSSRVFLPTLSLHWRRFTCLSFVHIEMRVRGYIRGHAAIPKDLTPLSLALQVSRKPLQLHKAVLRGI